MSSSSQNLPTVIFTTVVRATNPGDSHGGVYKLNLNTEKIQQVIDWDKVAINWEGRGGDRGLRGIAFHENCTYIASADEILKFNSDFDFVDRFTNRYLSSIHEIAILNSSLFITSTPRDSILEFDLKNESFVRGVNLRPKIFDYDIGYQTQRSLIRKLAQFVAEPLITYGHIYTFNPNELNGPKERDLLHVNTVFNYQEDLYISGTTLPYVFILNKGGMHTYAKIPRITHNTQPYKGGVILNDTGDDSVVFINSAGERKELYSTPTYPEEDLTHTDLSKNIARQGFGRGLCAKDNIIISGSSPATISVYDFEDREMVKQTRIENDIRSAVHGLEIWPF